MNKCKCRHLMGIILTVNNTDFAGMNTLFSLTKYRSTNMYNKEA